LWTNSFALLRKVIRLLKKQLIAANLTLTDSEATKFGPVYDQYSTELSRYGLLSEIGLRWRSLNRCLVLCHSH